MTNPLFISADPTTKRVRESHLPQRLSDAALTAKIQGHVPALPTDVVTSPQGINLILTNDPDYVGQPGDVVLRYEARKFFTDFAAGMEGWDQPWVNTTTWSAADGLITKGNTAPVARHALRAVDFAPALDVEVVAKARAAALHGVISTGVVARLSGAAASETGVVAGLLTINTTRSLAIYHYSGGVSSLIGHAPFPYVDGSFAWIRLQVVGTTASARAWADGSPEPSTWSVVGTVPAGSPGWTGVLATSDTAQSWDKFGASEGGPAPVTA